MKKSIKIFAFAGVVLFFGARLRADTTTPKLGLTKPDIGSINWGPKLNTNDDLTDSGTLVISTNNNITGPQTFSGGVTISSGVTVSSNTTYTNVSTVNVQGIINFNGATVQNLGVNAVNSYRVPVLKFNSKNEIDVETNTATANMTRIIFPDGAIFNRTENVATTQQYRALKNGQTAVFATNPVQGGIDVATGTAQTTYEGYAVKCTATGETTNYVLIASTMLPVQQNIAALNTKFNTNGWMPLGLIRKGNGTSAITQDFLNIVEGSDGWDIIVSSVAGSVSGNPSRGIQMATTASGTSVTYTTVRGISATSIPDTVDRTLWITIHGAAGSASVVTDSTGVFEYVQDSGLGAGVDCVQVINGPDEGLAHTWTTAAAGDIYLQGFHDVVRGVGFNPNQ